MSVETVFQLLSCWQKATGFVVVDSKFLSRQRWSRYVIGRSDRGNMFALFVREVGILTLRCLSRHYCSGYWAIFNIPYHQYNIETGMERRLGSVGSCTIDHCDDPLVLSHDPRLVGGLGGDYTSWFALCCLWLGDMEFLDSGI